VFNFEQPLEPTTKYVFIDEKKRPHIRTVGENYFIDKIAVTVRVRNCGLAAR